MESFFSIQIPRNFPFIARLPARFQMLVLEENNTTAKGTWYRVKIDGQELTILSRIHLHKGQKYAVEKKSDNELKIAKLFSKESATEKTMSKIKGHQTQKDVWHHATTHSQNEQENLAALLHLSQQDFSLFTAHLLSLLAFPSDSQKLLKQNQQGDFYFQTQWNSQQVNGMFKKREHNWQLYLSLPTSLLGADTEKARDELQGAMFGLPIEKVVLTSFETIKSLSGGVNIFG